MTTDKARGIAISGWWVLVIIVPVCILVLAVTITRQNNAQDRALQHSNKQFAKALAHSNQQFHKSILLTDHKFHQALQVANQKFAYSINSSACTLRKFLTAARTARLAAVRTSTDAKDRRLNQQAADTYKQLIDSQITVPVDFNCSKLIRPKR